MPGLVSYIPIATTVVALLFGAILLRRWMTRGRSPHLLCWGVGMVLYATGTITESLTTLLGWHAPIFRAWYISGALLGGAPLAQGTAYLLLQRKTAHRLSVALIAVILLASVCILATPIDPNLVEPYRLSGKVFEWHWVRAFSPFVNLYAVTFLIGGAFLSAWRYRRTPDTRPRYIGNLLIAVGAILPGIGGTSTRFGQTEVLYVTEFIGLLLIYGGYRIIVGPEPTFREGTAQGLAVH